jgi:hypothetical protein
MVAGTSKLWGSSVRICAALDVPVLCKIGHKGGLVVRTIGRSCRLSSASTN